MTSIRNFLHRSGFFLGALLILSSWVATDILFMTQTASAAMITSRKLQVSSSANGTINVGNPGSGTNGQRAKHTFTFNLGSTGGTVGSIVIMYCDSPIPVGSSCTTPTGMTAQNVSAVTTTGSTYSGTLSLDTATANASLPTGQGVCNGAGTTRTNCIALTMAAPTAQTGTPTFTLAFGGGASDYVTNPSTDNQTFFARIAVYSTTSYGTLLDSGSVASSTAEQIDITAKVQEKLNFSVSGTHSAAGAGCTALSGSGALNLGDVNGVLDSGTAYDALSYFRISTNALNGTAVQYSGDTLRSGSNSITALSSETLSTPGTSQFGLGLNTADANHSFTDLTADAGYDEANGNINPTVAAEFNFSTASLTTPVTIATSAVSTTIGCDTGTVRYVGNISTTTPPGIYTTTITYIAVPTY